MDGRRRRREDVYILIDSCSRLFNKNPKSPSPYRKCDLEIDNQRWLATMQKRIQYGAQ
jgi:hypothetical protein